MKGAGTLIVALTLAAVYILGPSANAVVRLTPTLVRRPQTFSKGRMLLLDRVASHHGLDWTPAQSRLLQRQQKSTASGGFQANITVEGYGQYDYVYMAEMSIGTPAQGPFDMVLNFGAHQPYVLKNGARYILANGTAGDKVGSAQEYYIKNSSTAAYQNADFVQYFGYESGKVVTDTVQIGSLSLNQSVQVAKKVGSNFANIGADGTLGLGVSYYRDGSSFVEQLASQLDSPVLTFHANRSFQWFYESHGELSFGDRLPETCDASSWQKLGSLHYHHISSAVVDTVSVTGPADSTGCGGQIVANITLGFYQEYQPIHCSVQVHELFVQASGARWDTGKGAWVVADASKAVSVKFHTASGDVIEVTPDDYLLCYGGTHYLYTYGDYDQNEYSDIDYIQLGQTFLNNHCLSMDMTSGEWSLASVLNSTETAYSCDRKDTSDTSTTSSPVSSSWSSSSSSEGVDYIGRWH